MPKTRWQITIREMTFAEKTLFAEQIRRIDKFPPIAKEDLRLKDGSDLWA